MWRSRQPTRTFPEPRAIPRMVVNWSELTGRDLSRREAYLLSCLDGLHNVEEIVDICAMSPLVAYCILDALVAQGIVTLA